MSFAQKAVLACSTIGSAMIAGVCFAFATFVMRSLDALAAPEAIRAMQAINDKILQSATIALWFAMVIVGISAAVLKGGSPVSMAAAGVYGVGAVLVTGMGNVPLNDELAAANPDSPDAQEVWSRYSTRWSPQPNIVHG